MQRVLMGLSGGTLCVAAALWLLASSTRAQSAASDDDVAAAARAFEDGQKAQLRGEYARAAELFELADDLAPTPEAARSAIRNHRAAGQLARAAMQALEAKARYADDPRTLAVADKTLARLTPMLARVSIACDAPCILLIDREALTTELVPEAEVFVLPGTHSIEARFGTELSDARELVLKAGEHVQLALREPRAARAEPAPDKPEPAQKPRPHRVVRSPEP